MVDIFFLFDHGDHRADEYKVVGHSLARGTHPRRDVEMISLPGLDIPVPVPVDAQSYLAHLYGEEWRTPVARWDWVFSPPNAQLQLRPVDIPIFIARWALYKGRQVRGWFRALSAATRP